MLRFLVIVESAFVLPAADHTERPPLLSQFHLKNRRRFLAKMMAKEIQFYLCQLWTLFGFASSASARFKIVAVVARLVRFRLMNVECFTLSSRWLQHRIESSRNGSKNRPPKADPFVGKLFLSVGRLKH